MKNSILFLLFLMTSNLHSQNFPWERPLKMAWSNDGITFNIPTIFQDSSGVPSIIRWKGDTLICAFQWFRAPVGSSGWDKVAVKFSYDNGISWTQPTPIVVNGLPPNYQRPFDPTLLAFAADSLRLYFSSSDGLPPIGLDSTVNTYSATGIDGINYTFEALARVDETNNRVIDPALIHFKNAYHYLSPIGSPQQGAYHYVSPNGLTFTKVPDIPSDVNHNWTGNYMINDTNELRFYGAGQSGIWFNTTSNGGIWNGYTNTTIQGGDPSVVKINPTTYLMVYVGPPYTTGLNNETNIENDFSLFPNPVKNSITVQTGEHLVGSTYTLYNQYGEIVSTGEINSPTTRVNLDYLSSGIYLLQAGKYFKQTVKVIKE